MLEEYHLGRMASQGNSEIKTETTMSASPLRKPRMTSRQGLLALTIELICSPRPCPCMLSE